VEASNGELQVHYLLKHEASGIQTVALRLSEGKDAPLWYQHLISALRHATRSLGIIFILKPGLCFFRHAV
jgi:hypothetical protein